MLEYVREKYYDDAYFKRHYHNVSYFIYGIHMYAYYLAYEKGCIEMHEEPWKILLALAHMPRIPPYEKVFKKYENVILSGGEWNTKHHAHEGYWLADMVMFDRDLRYMEREWEIKQRTSNNAAFEVPTNDSVMAESSSSHLLTPPSVNSKSPEYHVTTPPEYTPASPIYTPASPIYTPASPVYTPAPPPPYYSPENHAPYTNFEWMSSDSDYIPGASYETGDSRRN